MSVPVLCEGIVPPACHLHVYAASVGGRRGHVSPSAALQIQADMYIRYPPKAR
jgi:hypothetical protein